MELFSVEETYHECFPKPSLMAVVYPNSVVLILYTCSFPESWYACLENLIFFLRNE